MVIETFNYKETFEYGLSLGEKVLPGQVYCLSGDLGVGKTVFTQGFAKGLGIDEPVNSPTFGCAQKCHNDAHGDFIRSKCGAGHSVAQTYESGTE